MIWGNKKAVKVLFSGHNRADIVNVCVNGVSSPRDVCFLKVVHYALFDDIDGMVGNVMEISSHTTNDRRSDIGHVITGI